MQTINQTTIIIWNANGINSRKDELLHLMETRDVAAALICETRLLPGDKLHLANHTVFRRDRPGVQRAGGTAIIVDSRVRHHEIPLPDTASIEATGVLITTKTGPLRLIAAYCRPRTKLLPADIETLLDSNYPTIIGGDLNAKHPSWNSRVANIHGRTLLALSRRSDFTVAGPQEPTHLHIPTGLADVLDIAVVKNLRHSFELETLTELSSDHNPVLLTVGDACEAIQPITRYNHHKADWKKFQNTLTLGIEEGPLDSPIDVDLAVDNLTKAFMDARTASIPIANPRRCTIYDLPPGIKLSITDRNRARRQWQALRTPDLHERYKFLDRCIKEQIRRHRGEKWEEAVESLEPGSRPLWAMAKRLTRTKIPNPPIQGRTHLACSPQDKAEVLAESLENQFSPNPPTTSSADVETTVREHLAAHTAQTEGDDTELCTAEEVIAYVHQLANGKAPGLDEITNTMLKQLPQAAGDRLIQIFNASLRLQHFPSPWKRAKVIVFPKVGKNLRDPANYRPISLLSSLSKLLEKVILTRLCGHATSTNLLINEQFGFRQQHSTTHQLLRMVDKITNGYNTNRATGVVFLDVAKAFDRVWHEGLLSKLIRLEFPGYLVNLIHSYLTGRSFTVHINGATSSPRPILAGVPQGSIISPILFNLFTNDIPTSIPNTELALYADDAAIICQSFQPKQLGKYLQHALEIIGPWYDANRVAIHPDKTHATLFSQRRNPDPPEIRLDGKIITWTNTNLYLGVTLDSKLRWKEHVEKIASKANGKIAALYPLLKSRSMPLASKLRLIQGVIVPTMTYASPVWSGCSPNVREKLQKVQNKALKIALRTPMYTRTTSIHRDTGFELLDDVMLRQNENFYAALKTNANPLISHLAEISDSPHDRYPRPIKSLQL